MMPGEPLWDTISRTNLAEKNLAVELGRRGGRARAARMDPGKRIAAARTAGVASGEVRSLEARFMHIAAQVGETPAPAMLDYKQTPGRS